MSVVDVTDTGNAGTGDNLRATEAGDTVDVEGSTETCAPVGVADSVHFSMYRYTESISVVVRGARRYVVDRSWASTVYAVLHVGRAAVVASANDDAFLADDDRHVLCLGAG